MTSILRVKLRWSGFSGAPGYTIFHFRDFGGTGEWNPGVPEATAAVSRVNDFGLGIRTVLPAGVSVQTENTVEEIEDTTGELVDIWNGTGGMTSVGTGTAGAAYAAPVGAVINWRTNTVRKGRRIRGRSFVVPLAGDKYQSDGSLSADCITAITNAANALAAGTGTPDLGVYARPTRTKNTDGTTTTTPDGQWAPVGSVNIPDKAAVLRSRRD